MDLPEWMPRKGIKVLGKRKRAVPAESVALVHSLLLPWVLNVEMQYHCAASIFVSIFVRRRSLAALLLVWTP